MTPANPDLRGPLSTSTHAAYTMVFACALALSHGLMDLPLRMVGWVFVLPNHDYLYVFAWTPIVAYLGWHRFGQSWHGRRAQVVAGVFVFASLLYLLAGGAQLYGMWVVPVGVLTLMMSALFLRQGLLVLTVGESHLAWPLRAGLLVVGPVLIIVASTIYLQPWSLVAQLPNATQGSYENLDLRGMHFNGVSFTDTNLSGADFSQAEVTGARFNNVILMRAKFDGARLENVSIHHVDLAHADFRGAHLFQSEISASNLRGANFGGAFLGRLHIKGSILCSASFEGITGRVYGWSESVYDVTTTLPDLGDVWHKPTLVEGC